VNVLSFLLKLTQENVSVLTQQQIYCQTQQK
jgi:hypothetical protein